MTASELMKRLGDHGNDVAGATARFLGNKELFQTCFEEFLREPNFAMLRAAVEDKNYTRSFEAAHALKGLSGNLGLSRLYAAACALVEALRAKRYDEVEDGSAAVFDALEELERLAKEQA